MVSKKKDICANRADLRTLAAMTSSKGLTSHLDNHSEKVTQQWVPNTLCLWEGCTSKAKFSTVTKFKTHLKNIHIQPLLCYIPRCSHKKPFRNEHDLERHVASIHHRDIRPYICPFPNCEAELKCFTRRDKLLAHIRDTEHSGDMFCPFPHCIERQPPRFSGFKTREDILTHFNMRHSAILAQNIHKSGMPHRCLLGLCSLSLTHERWGEYDLDDHLETCHGLSPASSSVASWRAENEGGIYVLKPELLQKLSRHVGIMEWKECTTCLKKQQAQDIPQTYATTLMVFQQSNPNAVSENTPQPLPYVE